MRCLFAAFCLYGIAAQAAATDEKPAKGTGTQVNIRGITLSLALPEKAYAGAEIPLAVSVKNQGKKDAVYYIDSEYRDSHLEVVDSKGNRVSLTRFGRIVLADVQEETARVSKLLQSGKEIKSTLNLARVFDLTVPDDYTVTFTRVFNEDSRDPIKVTISKFAFQVLEPVK